MYEATMYELFQLFD